MNRFFLFKTTFLSITAGLFVGILVYGLFEVDFSNTEALTTLLLKSLVTALATGFVLAILNTIFKLYTFRKETEKQL